MQNGDSTHPNSSTYVPRLHIYLTRTLLTRACRPLSNAFSANADKITWLLFLCLFKRCIQFIDLCTLNQPCFPGIKHTEYSTCFLNMLLNSVRRILPKWGAGPALLSAAVSEGWGLFTDSPAFWANCTTLSTGRASSPAYCRQWGVGTGWGAGTGWGGNLSHTSTTGWTYSWARWRLFIIIMYVSLYFSVGVGLAIAVLWVLTNS